LRLCLSVHCSPAKDVGLKHKGSTERPQATTTHTRTYKHTHTHTFTFLYIVKYSNCYFTGIVCIYSFSISILPIVLERDDETFPLFVSPHTLADSHFLIS